MKRKIVKSLLIHTKEELKKVINGYTDNAKKITLHCYDFKTKDFSDLSKSATLGLQDLSFRYWFSNHLFTLKKKKNIDIQIHTYNSLTSENITQGTRGQVGDNEVVFYIDHLGNTYKENEANGAEFIKVYNTSNSNAKILFDFVKELSNYAKDDAQESDLQNLSKLVESFLTKNKGKEKEILTMCIEKYLKEPMLQRISEFEELSLLFSQQSYKAKLDASFQTLIADIEAIFKESNQQMTQELVACFFNIVNIFDLKNLFSRSNLALMAVDIVFDGAKTLSNILEWVDYKYSFAIAHSILKLLVDDIAPIVYLFENRILNHTIIIDDKIFIELSGIRDDVSESKACLNQELALLVEFEAAIFDDIKKIDLHCTQGKEELQICTQNGITWLLNAQITSSNNRLTYIETPYFNSAKFVELIKDKEIKNPAEQGYNYLIICNAPYKQNAALNQALLDKLGSKPNYDESKKQELESEILYKVPKNYDERIDYSQYKLNIKDEPNKVFVVSLSPFVFVSKESFDDYKNAEEKFKELSSNIKDDSGESFAEYDDFLKQPRMVDKILNYLFINDFFKKTQSKKEFLEKEKELFLQGVEFLREYIESIHKDKSAYSALEVLCLSLIWYVIKNFYTSVQTNTQTTWKLEFSYEHIKIEGESLKILPHKSYIDTENKLHLCFSKQYKKEELGGETQVFCIEEFVEELEKIDDRDYEKAFKEFLQGLEGDLTLQDDIRDDNLQKIQEELLSIEKELGQKKPKIKISQAFELIMQEFIITFFPFSDLLFDLSGFNISKKLIKTLTNSHMKSFREFLLEELGLIYIAHIISTKNISIIHNQTINKAQAKYIRRKAFLQTLEATQRKEPLYTQKDKDIAKNYNFSFLKVYGKNAIRGLISGLFQDLALNIFNQTYATHYERNKKAYEKLKFLTFSYKYLYPYVIKRDDGVFYPMSVNNNFFSFNFNNIIIGGKLCTGAFKELDALYYSLQNTTFTHIRLFLLNKLLSYLVLDELRSMKDLFKKIEDIEFFNTRRYTQDLPTCPRYLKLMQDEEDFKNAPNASEAQKANAARFNKTMQGINQDERIRLYEEYKNLESKAIKKEASSQPSAIDAYHTAMNYLDDIYNDCFNTHLANNTPHPNKHREFLRALHTIGQNNIKALYVGLMDNNKSENIDLKQRERKKTNRSNLEGNNSNQTKEKRPKVIGRLAVTIIMEDGLWIG